METTETKVCNRCGRELPITSFKNTKWGHYTEVCTECATKKRRENQEKKGVDSRRLTLIDFTARELMEELHRRGYEGRLTYTEVHTIDISNF